MKKYLPLYLTISLPTTTMSTEMTSTISARGRLKCSMTAKENTSVTMEDIIMGRLCAMNCLSVSMSFV